MTQPRLPWWSVLFREGLFLLFAIYTPWSVVIFLGLVVGILGLFRFMDQM